MEELHFLEKIVKEVYPFRRRKETGGVSLVYGFTKDIVVLPTLASSYRARMSSGR